MRSTESKESNPETFAKATKTPQKCPGDPGVPPYIGDTQDAPQSVQGAGTQSILCGVNIVATRKNFDEANILA